MKAAAVTTTTARIKRAQAISSHYTDDKFRELVIYIAQRCADDPSFGSIKLNKILFHADFMAYGLFGSPITGMEYVKLEHGPGPKGFVRIREQMVKNRDIAIEKRPAGTGKPPDRVVALRDPDIKSHFTAPEIALVDEWIALLRGVDAYVISDLTHGYRGWRVARELGDPIPYGAVFLSDIPPTAYERQRAEVLIQQYSWDV